MSLQWNFPFYTGKVTTQAGTLEKLRDWLLFFKGVSFGL